MIKVISFDVGGTILHSKSLNEYNLRELTKLVGKPYEDVRKNYKDIFQTKKGSFEQLTQNFCDNLNIKATGELLEFFKEKFNEDNNISVIDNNIVEVIKKLKQEGYKIILFSNSCCLIKNNFEESFLSNIDDVFYSYDMGFTKDTEESYKIIQDKMKCLPHEFLHIGDTLSSDYVIPKKFGWNALYYGKTDDESIQAIESIEEILERLQGDLWKGKKYF